MSDRAEILRLAKELTAETCDDGNVDRVYALGSDLAAAVTELLDYTVNLRAAMAVDALHAVWDRDPENADAQVAAVLSAADEADRMRGIVRVDTRDKALIDRLESVIGNEDGLGPDRQVWRRMAHAVIGFLYEKGRRDD